MTRNQMNNKGWIKLHRKLADNPRATDPEWVAVWIFLLIKATHQAYPAMWKGQKIDLQPGQLITGRKQLSAETGVKESKIYRLLKCYENEHQIEQQKSNRSTLISIINWTDYQASEHQIEQQMNNHRTTDEQPVNTIQEQENTRTKEITPKPSKEGKKDNSNNNSVSTWKYNAFSKRLKEACEKVITIPKNANLGSWSKAFRKLHKIDGVTLDEIDQTLKAYERIIGKPFIPEAYSGKSFRAKYTNIKAAIRRQEKPQQQQKFADPDLAKSQSLSGM